MTVLRAPSVDPRGHHGQHGQLRRWIALGFLGWHLDCQSWMLVALVYVYTVHTQDPVQSSFPAMGDMYGNYGSWTPNNDLSFSFGKTSDPATQEAFQAGLQDPFLHLSIFSMISMWALWRLMFSIVGAWNLAWWCGKLETQICKRQDEMQIPDISPFSQDFTLHAVPEPATALLVTSVAEISRSQHNSATFL